jgi:hypothetical protein
LKVLLFQQLELLFLLEEWEAEDLVVQMVGAVHKPEMVEMLSSIQVLELVIVTEHLEQALLMVEAAVVLLDM